MNETPRSKRLHIALVGRRNAGKSSLLNILTGQEAALVSAVPGTTTDPVWKAMELIPFGPVVFIDTAGLDDEGDLGIMRIKRTLDVLDRSDMVLIVADPAGGWTDWEQLFLEGIRSRKLPAIVVWTKADAAPGAVTGPANVRCIAVSAKDGRGIDELKEAIIQHAPPDWDEAPLIADLIAPNDPVILVVPIDREAPRGRLILAQVQTIREVLDSGAQALVTRDSELAAALGALSQPPKMVVTDSQVFGKVGELVPDSVPLTSFSILFARHKGDLETYVHGAKAIDTLSDGDRILIAESCTHHSVKDDIAQVKIPRWLKGYTGRDLQFEYAQGAGFPEDLSPYSLIIQCGGCMTNRRDILARIGRAHAAGVPVTNYGVAIAKMHGILDRAIEPLFQSEAGQTCVCER